MTDHITEYSPTMNSTGKEDYAVWKQIIAIIQAEQIIHPSNIQLQKMLKLLQAHSAWFDKNI